MSAALIQDASYDDEWTDEPSNPFPGLRSFEPDEDHLFFGREKQVDELMQRLRKTRFLSVVGTSGSGKSSLIRSGLVPSLYSGYMVQAGSAWRMAIFRPGDDPIGNLATALSAPEILAPEDADDELVEMNRELVDATLRRGALGMVEAVRQARIPADENLLVIADQFEELFRFKTNRQQRHTEEDSLAFVKLLLEASKQAEVPIYVVITMRSDFIGNCTEFPGLAEAINDGQYLVPRMTREERREAIVGPVAVGGAEISPRLVTRLLNDVGDDLDQLPILQHALMRTWNDWEENRTGDEPLDLHHFEAVGTLTEALSQHGEEAFQELDERQREIAEKMFKALTDKGTETRGVRNPRRLSELCEIAEGSEEEIVAVIEIFRLPGRTFLMPPHPVPLDADSIIDISHESLMRVWTRLIHWVDEEARSARIYLGLAKAAALFQEGKAGLWRDPELQMALNWEKEARPTALWARRYDPSYERAMLFLESSRKENELQILERERQRRRQLTMARWIAVAAGLGFLLMAVLGLLALQQKMEAKKQERIAQEQRQVALGQKHEAERQKEIAEQRKKEADLQKEIAEQEREKALEEEQRAREQEREARRQRRQAVAAQAEAEVSEAEALEQKARAETERERARTEKERAEMEKERAEVSEAEARRLSRLSFARALAEQCLRLRVEEPELAALLAVEAFRIHRESGGDARNPPVYGALARTWRSLSSDAQVLGSLHEDAVRTLAVDRDGHVLLSGGDDGHVSRFDLRRPDYVGVELAALGSEVRAVAVSADGRRAAAGTLDGTIHLWDGVAEAAAGAPRAEKRKAHSRGIYGLAFAGEDRLVSGGADGSVKLWRLPAAGAEMGAPADPTPLLDRNKAGVLALTVSLDGRTLAVALDGAGARLWDLRRPEAPPTVFENEREVRALAASPDGRHLAAGTLDGHILVWTVDDPAAPPQVLLGHTAQVDAVSWAAPDLLATASLDSSVRLWRIETPNVKVNLEPIVLDDHDDWVWAVSLVPGGEWVISGGADTTVRLRPTRMQPLADAICRRLPNGLEPEQWREYLPEDLAYRPTCPEPEIVAP